LEFLKRQKLLQLGDRPQLLDIIIQSLPKLKQQEAASGHALSTGALYRIYTDKWLDDYKPVERQSNSEQLRCILAVLAQELWQREGNRMHYGDLYLLIKDRADLRGKLDPNQLDVELRTAAFLSRTPDGFYGFSHRSFLEFFFARHIVQTALDCQASGNALALQEALNVPRLSREIAVFARDLTEIATNENEGTNRAARAALLQGAHTILDANQPAPAPSHENAWVLAAWLL
jgi:predicted NACHT family NTPase